jgi:macrolide transport system ATP-binding/permease protein
MQLLQVEGLAKSFGVHDVFSGVSFFVNAGEKAALVAPNGAGKTTLLRIIRGEIQADAGKVTFFRPDVRIGYLPQTLEAEDEQDVGGVLSSPPTGSGPTLPPGKVQEALKRFGLDRSGGPGRPVSMLSGGERTRLALARLWLQDADFLLLDEPTNHLDLAGLGWLAGWVRDFRGAAIIVSHDRYFLDQVAGKVISLQDGTARSYPGNYSAYRAAREAEIEFLMARYREQERLARKLREAVARQAGWFEQAHRAAGKQNEIRSSWVFYRSKAKKAARRGQALQRRLDRLEAERVEKPASAPRLKLSMHAEGRAGRFLVVAEGLAKAYGAQLFSGAGFTIGRGEKVGLVGANGSGKTTLLRIIARETTADSGAVRCSPAARVGYLDQHASGLHDGRTVLDEVCELTGTPGSARNVLGSFLFREEMALARAGTLSLGERSRLALLKLLLSPNNILLLDEPTNHLDLPSREQVEAALAGYEGAVLLVSHDRYLLRRLCTKILSLESGRLLTYHGGYEDYAAKVGRESLGRAPGQAAAPAPSPMAAAARPPVPDLMLLENQVAVLSARLAALARGDPEYDRTVEAFLEKARSLALLREHKTPGQRITGSGRHPTEPD